jgi:hypothetical protein
MSGWRKRQVVEMARESWLDVYGLGHDRESFIKALEAFAELVRADEREMLAQTAPYMAVSTDRMSVDPHTGNVSIGTVAQPAPVQKRPQNCGTGYCSCVECVMEPAAPVQPVAWWIPKYKAPDMVSKVRWSDECEPLYTTPPVAQREFVGLTDEEAQWLYDNCRTPSNLIDMVEAKLKEKNT